MRKLCIVLILALSSCSTFSSIPTSPVSVCNKTTLDEQTGTAAEAGYMAFRRVVETWVDMGLMKPATARAIRPINTALFQLTLKEQTAYKTCNAASYADAINEIKNILPQGYAALAAK